MDSPLRKRKETSQSMRDGRRSSACRPNKVGLARLAKTRSLSSSTGNISESENTFSQFTGSSQNKAPKPKACVFTNPALPPSSLTLAKTACTSHRSNAHDPPIKPPRSNFKTTPEMPATKNVISTKVLIPTNKSLSSNFVSTETVMESASSEQMVCGHVELHQHKAGAQLESGYASEQINDATFSATINKNERSGNFRKESSSVKFFLEEPDPNLVFPKISGQNSRLSNAPLASFDESFDMETSSESYSNSHSIASLSAKAAKKTSFDKIINENKCENKDQLSFPGVHSLGDLVDYAHLNCSSATELESTGLLNRHIGSIRRFLGRTSSSAHASPDRHSPVIRLSESKADHTSDSSRRQSSRRRLSGSYATAAPSSAKELTVPTQLLRSSSLNMLSEAFSAVHNLCVVPANAGTALEEGGRHTPGSVSPARSCSPVLSSSPPASGSPGSLNVASGASPQSGPYPQSGSYRNSSPRAEAYPPSNMPVSYPPVPLPRSHFNKDKCSPRKDKAFLASNLCGSGLNGRFIVSDINGDQLVLLPKSPLAYNEFPVTTGQTKFNFSEKKTKLRKKKKGLGETLQRLRGGSVSPSSSVHSSRENSSSVSLDTTSSQSEADSAASVSQNSSNSTPSACQNSSGSTCNSTPSKSASPLKSASSSSASLPLLMAQLDRCACTQPSPCVSRSLAFRDSRRHISSSANTQTCEASISMSSSKELASSDQSLSSSACASASLQSSLVSSNSSGRATVVHRALGSSSSGNSQDSVMSCFSSALNDESSRSSSHDNKSEKSSINDITFSPKHRPKPDTVTSPAKRRAVRCSSSPPVTARDPVTSDAQSAKHGSLLSLQDNTNEWEIKLRPKESRPNRKDRVNRNRNAQLFLHKKVNGIAPEPQPGMGSPPSSGHQSSAALPASCQEMPSVLRNKKAGLERTGRPQSWGSGGAASLPGVAAAIGTMVASTSGTITPSDSPCQSPLLVSPSGSLDRLDLQDDQEEYDEPATSSATAAILGAINTSEMRARSYLYGGLDFLLGPRELDSVLPDRDITVFIATWNMNGKEPPAALDHLQLGRELAEVPHIYVVGTQESGVERRAWEVRLQSCVGQQHVLLTSAALGILHLNIFVRRDLIWFFTTPEEGYHSLRPGTYFKTKGATAIAFQFFGTKFLFINSHLFAHEEKCAQRIQNIKNISHALDLPRTLPVKHKHKDATKRFDCVFWLGDLNFRLVANRDHVLEKLSGGVHEPGTVPHLLQWDQLTCARKKGETLIDFEEGEITFAPTFKFDPGTDSYDSSSKQRVPSYTDRILFKSPRSSISCLEYDSSPMFRSSDHKPVWGLYRCKIRPGKDDVPLNAGQFNREVYVEALKRRRKLQQQLMRKGEDPEGGCSLQ